jgi:hypothetical protein
LGKRLSYFNGNLLHAGREPGFGGYANFIFKCHLAAGQECGILVFG